MDQLHEHERRVMQSGNMGYCSVALPTRDAHASIGDLIRSFIEDALARQIAVDAIHPQLSATPLMVACQWRIPQYDLREGIAWVLQLLEAGAKCSACAPCGLILASGTLLAVKLRGSD